MKASCTMFTFCIQFLALVAFTTAEDEKGHWGEWGSLSPCSVTCGSGTMSMERVWIPGPGEPISKEPWTSTKVFSCTDKQAPECPQDGHWSGWGAWSGCTKACGGGMRERHRECTGVSNGGKQCEGEKFDEEACGKEPCPVLPRNFDMSQCKEETNFTCVSQKMCIPRSQYCDKKVQCHDGSDEQDCPRINSWNGGIRYDLSRGRNGVASIVSAANVVVGSLVTAIIMVVLH